MYNSPITARSDTVFGQFKPELYAENKKSCVLFQVLGQKWSIFSAMFLKYDPSFFRTERGSEDSSFHGKLLRFSLTSSKLNILNFVLNHSFNSYFTPFYRLKFQLCYVGSGPHKRTRQF